MLCEGGGVRTVRNRSEIGPRLMHRIHPPRSGDGPFCTLPAHRPMAVRFPLPGSVPRNSAPPTTCSSGADPSIATPQGIGRRWSLATGRVWRSPFRSGPRSLPRASASILRLAARDRPLVCCVSMEQRGQPVAGATTDSPPFCSCLPPGLVGNLTDSLPLPRRKSRGEGSQETSPCPGSSSATDGTT
jgi:hypothetical protein